MSSAPVTPPSQSPPRTRRGVFGALGAWVRELFGAGSASTVPDHPLGLLEARSALDALEDGVVLLDRDGNLRVANEAARRLIGLPAPSGAAAIARDGLIEMRLDSRLLLLRQSPAPPVSPALAAPWLRALATGATQRDVPMRLRGEGAGSSSGAVATLAVSASALRDAAGSICGAIVVVRDRSGAAREQSQLNDAFQALTVRHRMISTQNDDLRRLAMIDPLSGALNRRAFFDQANDVFLRATRARASPLSTVLLDIDHFKAINDTHGHQVGDRAIQSVARLLLACVRTSDLVCRYGGEEFAVLLPGIDGTEAAQIAERLRQRIEAEAGLALTKDGSLRITASFGVAEYAASQHGTLEQLLADTDKLLYRAKRRGRNQVCLLNRDGGTAATTRSLRALAEPQS